MKVYKVKQVIKLLEADGWVLEKWKGDHRQFKHPTKKGKVTNFIYLLTTLYLLPPS